MTQDEIIRMAREAGFEPRREMGVWGGAMHELKSSELNKLKRFAALVAANERENSAKMQGDCTLAEQAEQEPVACIIHTEKGDYLDWSSKGYCFYTGETPLYAAPVRTKDLTPHEITDLIREGAADGGWQGFAQSVIAADREKNNANNNT